MAARGRFITLEGGEGVGKTSNLRCVAETLREWGMELTMTREPGGTELGERLRELILLQEDICPEAELLMLFAARVQHLKRIILPALAAGRWVLSDRFTDASYAYQGGGRGIADETIRFLETWALAAFQPDFTLLLDAPVEIGLARARSRGATDRFENEKVEFLDRVRQAYLRRARFFQERIAVIDASRSAEAVRADVIAHVEHRFADECRIRS